MSGWGATTVYAGHGGGGWRPASRDYPLPVLWSAPLRRERLGLRGGNQVRHVQYVPVGASSDDGRDCAALRHQTIEIRPGDPGIERTVDVMKQLIQAGAGVPVVRDHAERAVVGVSPGRPLEELRALVTYIKGHVNYRRDPVTHEWIKTPWLVACQITQGRVPQLDCDDLTVFSLALAGSIGFDTIIRVVSTRRDEQFNHVYGLVELDDATVVPLDLVRAWAPKRSPWPRETRVMEVAV